jgi:hypothetical protein
MRIQVAAAMTALALLSACVSPKKYTELQTSYEASVQRAEALKVDAEDFDRWVRPDQMVGNGMVALMGQASGHDGLAGQDMIKSGHKH